MYGQGMHKHTHSRRCVAGVGSGRQNEKMREEHKVKCKRMEEIDKGSGVRCRGSDSEY